MCSVQVPSAATGGQARPVTGITCATPSYTTESLKCCDDRVLYPFVLGNTKELHSVIRYLPLTRHFVGSFYCFIYVFYINLLVGNRLRDNWHRGHQMRHAKTLIFPFLSPLTPPIMLGVEPGGAQVTSAVHGAESSNDTW